MIAETQSCSKTSKWIMGCTVGIIEEIFAVLLNKFMIAQNSGVALKNIHASEKYTSVLKMSNPSALADFVFDSFSKFTGRRAVKYDGSAH